MSGRVGPITPSRLRVVFQAPELAAPQRIAADPLSAVKKAEDIGYVDGFFDRHSVNHEFHCGAEWVAWLAGWRRGQIELKRQRESAEQLMMFHLSGGEMSHKDFAPCLGPAVLQPIVSA